MTTVTRAVLPVVFLLGSCGPRPPASKPAPRVGSNVVLTAEDIERSPGQSLEQLLLARVPGLSVTRSADGTPVLRLRGTTTILGDEDPLFIVNGSPLSPNLHNLTAINPRDIDTVEVLRDAAATAIYGIRGANGVIVIRTKT